MQIKTKSGRIIEAPTPEEDMAINAGIAADPDNPEWTDEDFGRAQAAHEVLPKLLGQEGAQVLLRKRGRPAGSGKKEQITVRFDTEVINAFRASGDGWQVRMNEALREWLKSHGKVGQE